MSANIAAVSVSVPPSLTLLFTDRDRRFATPALSSAVPLVAYNAGALLDISPASLAWLDQAVKLLLDFLGADPYIDELSAAMLQAWHSFTLDRVSPVTANNYLRAIRVIYSRLVDRGYVVANPAAMVPYASEPPRRPRAILTDHYLAMRAVAGERDRAILDMLWASGCRRGGLLSMRVDRLERWGTAERPALAALVIEKGNKSRYVYAKGDQARSVCEYLEGRPLNGSPALWLGRTGRPLSAGAIQSIFRRLRSAADIPPGAAASPHSFRHAFAIRKLDAGHDLATVSQWLGHADPAFTAKIYAVRTEDQLRRAFFGPDGR